MPSSDERVLTPVTFLVYDAYSGGGVSRTLVNLANEMARTRPVRVLSVYRQFHVARFRFDPAVEVTVLRDVRAPRRARSRRERLVSRLRPGSSERRESRVADKLLRKAIRKIRSGVIVSTRPSLHLALTEHARRGVTTVGWDHLNYPARMSIPHQAEAINAAVPRLDGYVVLTHADADDYRANMPGLSTVIEVIPNTVSWPIATAPPVSPDKVVIGAGRLVRRKGFVRLVEAFAPVAAAHPDWQLHIYGRGVQEGKLAALVEELGIGQQVRLQGYTEDLPGALRRASVYAMASLSEGFPMVLIEAMSLGLPLIAYDCPRGPAEIIRHERNGLLIKNHRHRVYTQGLMRLVEDAELREQLGKQALLDAENYTVAHAATQWQSLFDRLGEERTRSRRRRNG